MRSRSSGIGFRALGHVTSMHHLKALGALARDYETSLSQVRRDFSYKSCKVSIA